MSRTLRLLQADPGIELSIHATGMHFSPIYGLTITEIEAAGLRIATRAPMLSPDASGAAMARNLGGALIAFTDGFSNERPNLVLILGDRGEMLAGALAALHLNIPIAHVHGGERSGTIDEPIRHAISKLAHYHFVATNAARERLIRMGERTENIFITGAPGLDGLIDEANIERESLCIRHRLNPAQPVVLLLFHPVVQEASRAGHQMEVLLEAVSRSGAQCLCLHPNSDSGAADIRGRIEAHCVNPGFRSVTHLERQEFLSWLRHAQVLVGNSSSGIIEAATFGLPVINVGDRQNNRERNQNVIDVPVQGPAVLAALQHALARPRFPAENIYGQGLAGPRIVELLRTLPLDQSILMKTNAY
jgi:GDP/UDP-N,N'-diacetylbacillosamine 2-epimerase (hydrolysing)